MNDLFNDPQPQPKQIQQSLKSFIESGNLAGAIKFIEAITFDDAQNAALLAGFSIIG